MIFTIRVIWVWWFRSFYFLYLDGFRVFCKTCFLAFKKVRHGIKGKLILNCCARNGVLAKFIIANISLSKLGCFSKVSAPSKASQMTSKTTCRNSKYRLCSSEVFWKIFKKSYLENINTKLKWAESIELKTTAQFCWILQLKFLHKKFLLKETTHR